MAIQRSTFRWSVRAVVLGLILLLNFGAQTSARSGDCELCALCPRGMDFVPCCAPVFLGLCGTDDCHDDDDECHQHGTICCASY